jgi:hypothetical protein
MIFVLNDCLIMHNFYQMKLETHMKKNLGTSGRLLRLSFGLLLLIVAWAMGSWIIFALSLFTFYEAFASWCIIYQLLGKNSCPIEKNKKDE